jgi:excisionase family DNA binding protein
MSSNPPEIMTIGETAQYLRISQSSLYKLAQEGRIPCQKVGRHWRFRKQALDRWLETYSKTGVPTKIEDTEEKGE